MHDNEASTETHHDDTFDTRMRLLTEAAGMAEARARDAFAGVAHAPPYRTVTPALARFSRVFSSNSAAIPRPAPSLGTRDRCEVVVKLPIGVRHRILPVTRVEAMLSAIEADCATGRPTAALADALAAVLHVRDRQTCIQEASVLVRVISEAIATPLNALLRLWEDDEYDPAAAPPTSCQGGQPMLPHPPTANTPIAVICAATYNAEPRDQYAFVFQVPATNSRFTVYAASGYRYEVGNTYKLTLSEPGEAPLYLPADDAEFLRHCLNLVEGRWQEAIAEADAGRARPEADRTAEPGSINIEPDPSGDRSIGEAFRDELGRVRRLRERVDQFLAGLLNPGGDPS